MYLLVAKLDPEGLGLKVIRQSPVKHFSTPINHKVPQTAGE